MPAHLRPITVNIPADWTPEQALAVLDLLDDLSKKIWTRYSVRLQPLLQDFHKYAAIHDNDGVCDDQSI
jgi:hypothetical protein